MSDDELEALDEMIEKMIDTVTDRGLRLEVEFDDQDVSVGDSTVRLNGKTVIEGDQ